MGVKWLQEERTYTSGVSHGVYFSPTGDAVPWNGLLSVQEVVSNANAIPRYLDGLKRRDVAPKRVYQGVVRALALPEDFGSSIGEVDVVPGVVLTRQPRKPFNMSYETNVNGENRVIHLVNNVTVSPMTKSYSSIAQAPEPSAHIFRLDAVPPKDTTMPWPTAHLIIDSTKMPDFIFEAVEDLIYGTSGTKPTFPTYDLLRYVVGNPLLEPLMEPI